MDNQQDDPRLTKLESELKEARSEFDKDYNPPEVDSKSMNDGARAGIELVGSLLGGALIGYGIDHFAGTSPIFFLIFVILGVFVGFYNIYKITLGTGTSVGFKGLKKDSKDAKQHAKLDKPD